MTIGAIFKKYPKEIVKRAVVEESDPFYKDIVLPCLKKNAGSNPEAALIREICHIPKEKLSANDLRIFISACRGGAFAEIVDSSRFVREIVFQSIKEDNEDLFLLLLDQEITERCSSNGVLRFEDLNELLVLCCEKGWQHGARKLVRLGANVNQQFSSGKTLLQKVFEEGSADREKSFAIASLLLENGASISGIKKESLLEFFTLAFEEVEFAGLDKVIDQDPSLISEKCADGKTLLQMIGGLFHLAPRDNEAAELYEKLVDKTEALDARQLKKDFKKALGANNVRFALKLLRRDKAGILKAEAGAFLHLACFMGSIELIEELLKRGADPNCLDDSKRNAAHALLMGRAQDKERIALLLKSCGVDFHCKDKEGVTPALLIPALGIKMDSSLFPLTSDEIDFLQKKVAGHVSTIPSCQEFAFEFSYAPIMAGEIAESLKDFFLDPREEDDPIVRERLIETFDLASKETEPEVLASRIQRGLPTIKIAGWSKHYADLAFIDDPFKENEEDGLLAICNTGDGITKSSDTIKVIRINRKKVTAELLQTISDNLAKDFEEGFYFLYTTLPQLLAREDKPMQNSFCLLLEEQLGLSLQKGNHCAYSSFKAALRFLWAALLYVGKEKDPAVAIQAKKKTKRWSLSAQIFRLGHFSTYLQSLKKPKLAPDEVHYFYEVYDKIKKRIFKTHISERNKKKLAAIVHENPVFAMRVQSELLAMRASQLLLKAPVLISSTQVVIEEID